MTAARDLERFRKLLAEHLGWTFADSDGPHLSRALQRRAAARGLDEPAYLSELGRDGWSPEVAALAEDLSITETHFFRHIAQFRALVDVALPERLAVRRAERVLHLLSVGCSSGEEAYGLAIAARAAQPDSAWTVSVLGLDANPAMLRVARAARYSAWSLRETPEAVRQTRFRPHGNGFEVEAGIRDCVTFREHNVVEPAPALWRPGQYDVIFCRNLLMYLTPETAAGLIRRMTMALAPGGFLFLGHTDSLGARPDGLDLRRTHSTFYYCQAVPPAPEPVRARPERPETPHADPPPAEREQILTLLRQERFTDALREIELGDLSRPGDQLMHGVLLALAGRLDEAEALARRLVDADGLYADAHHLLGMCLEDDGAVDLPVREYRMAAYLDPVFALPRLRLGLLARRSGDDRGAAADLDRALRLMPGESEDRIVLFGGGFGRPALTALCRAGLDACEVRR